MQKRVVITIEPDGTTNIDAVNVSDLESGGSWQYQVDGAGAWLTGSGSSFQLSDGLHSYLVRQTDQAGNTANSTGAIALTSNAAAFSKPSPRRRRRSRPRRLPA